MSLSQWQKGTGAFDARSLGGQLFVKAFEFDFSTVDSYTTGGVACDISQFYNDQKHAALIAPKGGYVFEYVPSTKKIKVYVVGEDEGSAATPGALAEVAATTDLSDIGTVQILAWGM